VSTTAQAPERAKKGRVVDLKIFLREELPERLFELRTIVVAQFKKLFRVVPRTGFIIGPTNSANQATAWARSLPEGESLRIAADPATEWFHADHEVKSSDRNAEVHRISILHEIFSDKGSILLESLRPIFAFRKGRQGFASRHSVDDLILLRRMGKRVGVVFHGSDIRDPAAHLARNPYSPFQEPGHPGLLRKEAIELLEVSGVNRSLLPRIRKKKIPLFVTTPDLFHEVPDAIWLPAVIDIAPYEAIADSSPLFASKKLRVLYLPSKSWLKSSGIITPILEKLRDEGVIEYQNWVDSGPVLHDQIPKIFSEVDLVIDQFIGLTGVFALEAAAAGRIVATYIDPLHAHHPTLPHININPETLESKLRSIAREREKSLMYAQVPENDHGQPQRTLQSLPIAEGVRAAQEFVRFYHDGRFSSSVIKENLK
jgi:hypothetical protein